MILKLGMTVILQVVLLQIVAILQIILLLVILQVVVLLTIILQNNNNNDNSNSNNSNSNNNDKQEETVDKSAFNGKDAIISEGQPFNPMNALQLYACDITGENITNSIVITENNVDIYKPGVYNVKASIALKNGKT